MWPEPFGLQILVRTLITLHWWSGIHRMFLCVRRMRSLAQASDLLDIPIRCMVHPSRSQINLGGITADDTRYFYVFTDMTTRLIGLNSRRPETDKHVTLKLRLENTFRLNKWERTSRLLHLSTLRDSNPSVLMDGMLSLLGEHKSCSSFNSYF